MPRFYVVPTASKTPDRLQRLGVLPLCPCVLLDINPQCVFNDQGARRRALFLLDLIDSLDEIRWKKDIHRHAASRHLPRPMGKDALANVFWFSVTAHDG